MPSWISGQVRNDESEIRMKEVQSGALTKNRALGRIFVEAVLMKRYIDLLLVGLAGLVLSVPVGVIALLVRLTSPGPILYWSDRVGRDNRIFKMPKFRSMQVGTPAVATHLLSDPKAYLTPIGSLLRKSSLDELPQLWSIWVGDMSFVGPRPALFNQVDLIALRTEFGIGAVRARRVADTFAG